MRDLIAHDWGDDLQPETEAFNQILTEVPAGEQLDLYCVISGSAGCRGETVEGKTLLRLAGADEIPIEHFNNGDGALAFFLFATIAVLNAVRLGEPSILRYLALLPNGP